MSSKKISGAIIRRLPMYLFFFKDLKHSKAKYVSAIKIAESLHIDSTQITKDFKSVNIKGKPKVGYEIEVVIGLLEKYLGYDILRKAFLVGVGNLGTALLSFTEFNMEGMQIIKVFDNDIKKIGKKINKTEILDIKTFELHNKNTPVDIVLITVPTDQAQSIADLVVECNIKAIWNFTTMPLSVIDEIIVENTCIDSGLAMIKWKLQNNMPLIYKNRVL